MFEFELINGDFYDSDDNFLLLVAKKINKENTLKQFNPVDVMPRIVNEKGKLGYIDLNGNFIKLEIYRILDVISTNIISVKIGNKIDILNINSLINQFGYVGVQNETTMEMFFIRKVEKKSYIKTRRL